MKAHVVLMILAAAAPQWALAQASSGKNDFLANYDTNRDGRVSRAEYDAKRGEDYRRTDADKNGTLTEAEYVAEYTARLEAQLAAMKAAQVAQAHSRFGALDGDKDGRMTEAEYGSAADFPFSRLDTNRDGTVDQKDTAQSF